jgi:mRNA-binding protein PUF3
MSYVNSLALLHNSHANFLLEKLLTQLKGAEYDELVELIKPQLAFLKRFSYGKQIAAIEKVVYTNPLTHPQLQPNASLPAPIDTSAAPTPPLLTGDAQSPQSSSLPSTNASSVGGHADSRKSSASNTVEVLTPTST